MDAFNIVLILAGAFLLAVCVAFWPRPRRFTLDELMARSESPSVWRFLSDVKSGKA